MIRKTLGTKPPQCWVFGTNPISNLRIGEARSLVRFFLFGNSGFTMGNDESYDPDCVFTVWLSAALKSQKLSEQNLRIWTWMTWLPWHSCYYTTAISWPLLCLGFWRFFLDTKTTLGGIISIELWEEREPWTLKWLQTLQVMCDMNHLKWLG